MSETTTQLHHYSEAPPVYSLPDIHPMNSYDEMVDHNGIATYFDEELAELLASMRDARPYEIVGNALKNVRKYFPGFYPGNATGFSSPGSGYSEASEWHIDPEGRSIALVLAGEARPEFTEMNMSDHPPAHHSFDIMNINQVYFRLLKARIVENQPPPEFVAGVTLKPGSYVSFNGGARCDYRLLNPHRFISTQHPRLSISSYQ